MKKIKKLNLSTIELPATASVRNFSISGDPGAVFTFYIQNNANKYYSFETKSFQNDFAGVKQQEIDESGVYQNIISFPTVSSSDNYNVYLKAETYEDTELSKTLVRKGFLYKLPNYNGTLNEDKSLKFPFSIYQYVDIAYRIIARSFANFVSTRFSTLPSSLASLSVPSVEVVTGTDGTMTFTNQDISTNDSSQVLSIPGPITEDHFFHEIEAGVSGTVESSTEVTLTSIPEGLAPGMSVIGKDNAGVTFTAFSPHKSILTVDTSKKKITLSSTINLQNNDTLYIRGYGVSNVNRLLGFTYSVTNAEVSLPIVNDQNTNRETDFNVVAQLETELQTSTNVVVNSTEGIKAGNTISATGLGLTSSDVTPTVASVTNATTFVLSAAMASGYTIEAGTFLYFTGSNRKAFFSATVNILTQVIGGSSTRTLFLDLDKVLTFTDNF